jgi:hypothetical protein
MLTLWVVPVVFVWVERLRRRLRPRSAAAPGLAPAASVPGPGEARPAAVAREV